MIASPIAFYRVPTPDLQGAVILGTVAWPPALARIDFRIDEAASGRRQANQIRFTYTNDFSSLVPKQDHKWVSPVRTLNQLLARELKFMRIARLSWREADGWRTDHTGPFHPNLVLYFGIRHDLESGTRFEGLRSIFPGAHIMGCSSGGQIFDNDVSDGSVAIALQFDATRVRLVGEDISGAGESRACGRRIGQALQSDDLAGVFVLSDGLNVNGSELVAGITGAIGRNAPVTGGLAGDGPDFAETLVSADCSPRTRLIAAVGFYGNAIQIGHGSAGGWDVFGPRRRITRASGNVLVELDGEPALDLYERYLGEEEVKGLPGAALLFPLQVRNPDQPDHEIVRTVLAVDRNARSMTFAGDVPQGWQAQLMRGNFDHLAAGAAEAARHAASGLGRSRGATAAILVSCIGRRLLMRQRIADEVEAASAALGAHTDHIGFYSYGEISPHAASGMCELHNQTMTVTALTEAVG